MSASPSECAAGLFRTVISGRDPSEYLAPGAVLQDMMLQVRMAAKAVASRWPTTRVVRIIPALDHGDRAFLECVEVYGNDPARSTLRTALAVERLNGRIAVLRGYYDRGDLADRLTDPSTLPDEPAEDGRVRPHAFAVEPAPADAVTAGLVLDFFATWDKLDPDALGGWRRDDAVYDNVPDGSGAPSVGREAIVALFQNWCGFMSGVEVEITGLAAENGIVWAERLDHVRFADGSRRTLPCLGRLEITDGAIARFTDYFDVRWFGRPQ